MASKIWIVLQQRDGKLHRMSREAITAGQRLAAEIGGEAEAVLLGSGVGELAQEVAGFDLARVYVANHELLGDYTPGGYSAVLAPLIRDAAPAFVVFPHTYQSVDYYPRLAQTLDAGLLPEITSFATVTGEGGSELHFQRPILGGKMVATVRIKGDGPMLMSVQSGAFQADDAASGSAQIEEVTVATLELDREILGVEEVSGDQVDLTKVDVIVAVGRGVGDADKLQPLRELAEVLGAELAASRPVIDSGWIERDRQIGSSGQTVAPKLYLAIGISGAIQHLVGMKGSGCIVAINQDKKAPIFNVSNYGIVGDLHKVVPALTAAIREARG